MTLSIPETGSLNEDGDELTVTVDVQVYSPESLVLTELIVAALVKVIAVSLVATEVVVVNCVPDGPFHTVLTVTGISTASLNLMVQVRVREEPVTTVPSGEAVTVTAVGGGTKLDNTISHETTNYYK